METDNQNNIQDEEQILNLSLRPVTLSEFIGQKRVEEGLQIAIEAARRRNDPLEHILFSGPQGLGKTTLALQSGNYQPCLLNAYSGEGT